VTTDSPIFIVGNPRSGTSMLRLMLTSHRNIVIPPECGFIVWWHAKYGALSGRDLQNRLPEFLHDLQASRKFDTWELDGDALREYILADLPTTYADLCRLVCLAWGRRVGLPGTRWGDKNNFHTRHVAKLAALFPNASFVHIVRDARDVASSYLRLSERSFASPYAPALPRDVEAIAVQWRDNVNCVRGDLAALPSHRGFEVTYESLVRTPALVLERICTYLGEPFDEQMLSFHEKNRALHLEPRATLAWKEETLQPVNERGLGAFANTLTEEEANRMTELCAEELRHYGYL
jgi:hypothetical protein